MTDPNVSILLIGNADRPEFRPARATLKAAGRVVEVPDIQSAAVVLGDPEFSAEVIVVAQAYPGEFSERAIDRLRRLAPLGRVVGLMGSWCEGETRTGRPWPGAIRVYWHQWPARCQRELRHLHEGRLSAWGLPLTASEEERLLVAPEPPGPQRQGLVGIYTWSHEMQDWLSAALRQRGPATVWLRPPWPVRIEGAAAVIFDGSDGRAEELEELRRLAASLGRLPNGSPVPILALLGFPRIEDHDRALAAGAAAVLSKPCQLDELRWHVDRMLEG